MKCHFHALTVALTLIFWSSPNVLGGGATAPTTAPSGDDDIDSLPVKAPDVGSITHRTTTAARDGTSFGLYQFSPANAGSTVNKHPTFYWFLSQPTDEDVTIVVTEADLAPGKPLIPARKTILRKTFTGTQPAGIYACALTDGTLQAGKLYNITVTTTVTGPTGPVRVNSEGYAVLAPDSSRPSDIDDPIKCAQAGLWYDAIDAAMRSIGKRPQDPGPHKQLHALLHGEHVLYNPGPTAKPADVAKARADEAKLIQQLVVSNDALTKH